MLMGFAKERVLEGSLSAGRFLVTARALTPGHVGRVVILVIVVIVVILVIVVIVVILIVVVIVPSPPPRPPPLVSQSACDTHLTNGGEKK